MLWVDKIAKKVSIEQINRIIKDRLRGSSSIRALFEQYDMDINRLDDLVIEIIPLDKKYAETDAKSMRLNTFLFEKGNFFDDYFFIVPHELVHWLSRIKEQEAYFNDPEEVLGFVASIAYEMEKGVHPDEIYNKIFPKISWHFHNESDAKQFFINMIDKAKDLIKNNTRGDGND